MPASVGAAYAYGIVKGVGDNRFQPQGTITRQEACVVILPVQQSCAAWIQRYRMRKFDSALAQLQDADAVASWARESVAFCAKEKLLEQDMVRLEPVRPILRGEIAQMLYEMLQKAKLL